LAQIIILAVFSQYLGVTIPFIGLALYFLQRFYPQTSRQVRLLGIEARAPLYTHFSETVAGAATIRAFGWQTQYRERNYRYIDTSQRPDYLQSCIQAWLTFVLNIMVVTWHDKFSAGSVGVSLLMVIGFSETLARLIQNWTKLESSVGAVARVKRFRNETESEETEDRNSIVPLDWPQSGAIEFKNVVVSYG
jgi:ATP-binding cassette subfamily C (CFTR/MRP) protein 1